MDDLANKMATLRDDIEVAWDEPRLDQGRERLARGLKRQAQIQAATRTSALLLLLGAAVGAGTLFGEESQPQIARGIAPAVPDIEFTDGSHGYLTDEGADLVEVAAGSDILEVELRRGGALFSVVRDESRTFRVSAGRARIEVLGTTFRVQRHATSERVNVSVVEGRVRVLWDDQTVTELERGESVQLPVEGSPPEARSPEPEEEPPGVSPEDTAARVVPQSAQRSHPSTPRPAPAEEEEVEASPAPPSPIEDSPRSWQQLAREREYDAAHDALSAQGPNAVQNAPPDLMLAADTARLSGHPAEAVRYLRQMLDNHASDARSSLAAFTMGRILLHQLGRPADAARAFRRARQLRPTGSMSEDALAREVEAWSRAGNVTQAQQTAREYEARYPSGRRLQAVRRHASFE